MGAHSERLGLSRLWRRLFLGFRTCADLRCISHALCMRKYSDYSPLAVPPLLPHICTFPFPYTHTHSGKTKDSDLKEAFSKVDAKS